MASKRRTTGGGKQRGNNSKRQKGRSGMSAAGNVITRNPPKRLQRAATMLRGAMDSDNTEGMRSTMARSRRMVNRRT